VIHRGRGRGPEEEEKEKEEAEEESAEEENPKVAMTRDHGLDFRLFNTMLAGC
jgi:hypothetical protein